MKTSLRILSFCSLALGSVVAPALAAAEATLSLNSTTTPRLVIKYKANISNGQIKPLSVVQTDARDKDIEKRARHTLTTVKVMAGGALVYHLGKELTLVEAKAVAARIAEDPRVESAEPDIRVKVAQATTNDKFSDLQWPLMDRTAAPGGANFAGAWALSKGSGVVIGVVDTGIVPHTDLIGQIVPGYDFIQDTTVSGDGDGRDHDPTDAGDYCFTEKTPKSIWHGLLVAGLLVAVADNNYGVAGAAHKSKVMPLRALGRCGGYMSDVSHCN